MLKLLVRWGLNVLYAAFFIFGLPWMIWRAIKGKSRRGWLQKLTGLVPRRDSSGPCIWMHAVSVGEVNLLASVIEAVQANQPSVRFAISTSTETGYSLAQKKYGDHHVFFCPYDFSWAIKNVIRRIHPDMLVLAELELWPNLIGVTKANKLPVVVVNGRLSEKSFAGYRKFYRLTSPMLRAIDLVLAQSETYADRFSKLGCDEKRVIVSGSVKFDGAVSNRDDQRTRQLATEAGFSESDFVFVAGSTQVEEDLIAARAFTNLAIRYPDLRLVLVPRHPERCNDLQRQLAHADIETTLRTDLPRSSTGSILIVNVIGELGHWWGRANAAYVGGSMGDREGQNMIEPSAFGLPVAFGPRTKNFKDVVEQLLSADAAMVVHNQQEVEDFVERCLAKLQQMSAMGARAAEVVEQNLGASQKTAIELIRLLEIDR